MKRDHLIDADPGFLQSPADRGDDHAEGELDLRPPVTTCDGHLKASALAEGSLVRIGDPYQDVLEWLAGLGTTDVNAHGAKEEMVRDSTVEFFHSTPPASRAR